MDHLDTAKQHVVNAMIAMEDALTEALPAQDPASDSARVGQGISEMRCRIKAATTHLSNAENSLKQLDRDEG